MGKNAMGYLAKSPETYDVTRVFTSGCSMGSAFSGYMGNCLKKWNPQQISAFATHSTGLKKKGDGVHLPENWGECDGCQWWPFAPVKYTDKLGYPSESHFASGGHCQNIPYSNIVKCLGISGSSPRPPSPGPSPSPTPSPRPHPTPRPSPSPSPSPDQPPAACQKCFMDGCPNLHKTAGTACQNCVRSHQGPCASSCVPYPFQRITSSFCGSS